MRYYLLLICLVLTAPAFLYAQVSELAPKTTTSTAEDSMVTVEILPGVRKLEFRKVNDSTQLQILAGNVRLKQGTALFYCDSCVINNFENTFEAWGHVHINDADTANVYAEHLRYLIRKKIAYLDGGVSLTDGKGTLNTPDLEYDMDTKIGIYKNGGKVKNKNSILTSKEGYYYTDLKDVYFKKDVELTDPAYFMKTDSLLYNTETATARFIAQTFIRDSSGRTVETREGYYNTQTGKAEFSQRPILKDGKVTITANQIRSDDSTGISQAVGNAVIVDSSNKTTIIAGLIFRNKKTEAILATQKPLMIVKQENDSVFITADTLFSARLSDLYKYLREVDSLKREAGVMRPEAGGDSLRVDSLKRETGDLRPEAGVDSLRVDSLKRETGDLRPEAGVDSLRVDSPKKETGVVRLETRADSLKLDTVKLKVDSTLITQNSTLLTSDSTNRYFEGYHHVRIYSDSMQAVCDSLFYSFKDSIFRLYQDPVVWANKSQITGDTILLYTKNKKADRVRAFNHSFMVNQLGPEIFNQVKSSRMEGNFTDGNIDSVRCSGLAECIYYLQDEDSSYTGINESKSDILDIYFAKKELKKVVFRSAVSGTIWPMRQKDPKTMRLEGFRWLEERRPKSKFQMME